VAELEFPRLVYKKAEGGNSQPIWNLGTFEVLQVADQDALDAAVADGWLQSPDEQPADAKPARSKKAADPQPDPALAGEAPQA
jgi:hypothetical protein